MALRVGDFPRCHYPFTSELPPLGEHLVDLPDTPIGEARDPTVFWLGGPVKMIFLHGVADRGSAP